MELRHCAVLIVEDDADARQARVDLLTLEGYEVASAANGAEALEYLRTSPHPCVIMLDLIMPVMNGWEFRERLKQDPALSVIPVVAMTGANPRQTPPIDVAALFPKPLEIDAVMQTVAHYCHDAHT